MGLKYLFTSRHPRQFQKASFEIMLILKMYVFTQSSRYFKTIIITVLGRNSISITIKHIEKRKHFIQTNNFPVVPWGLKPKKQKYRFEKVGEAAEINETKT